MRLLISEIALFDRYPGNQNFSLYCRPRLYSYTISFNNPFGLGVGISSYGNPNLEWQKTIDQNFGFDVEIFHRRLRSEFRLFYEEYRSFIGISDLTDFDRYSFRTDQSGKTDDPKGIHFRLMSSCYRRRS